jgi:UDP-N-acetylenolpyruvoylglucosamine reductase
VKRTQTKSALSGNEVKIVVRLESEACEARSMQGRMQQVETLRQLTSNPELMNCGYSPFQRLVMRHNGEAWVIEMEGITIE